MTFEKFEYGEAEGTMTKREINGNTYVVVLYQKTETFLFDKLVLVFADERTGADHGFTDHPNTLPREYDEVARMKVEYGDDVPIETRVSRAVNEAVCQVEDKKGEEQRFEDALEAALEANREVHGGLDYELERATEG